MLHGGTPPRDFVRHALGNASPILGTTINPVALLILAAFLPPGGTYDIIFDCTIIPLSCDRGVVYFTPQLRDCSLPRRANLLAYCPKRRVAHPRRYCSLRL